MANQVPQPTDDRVTDIGRRLFSQFALENNVYCVPVDVVSKTFDRATDRPKHRV